MNFYAESVVLLWTTAMRFGQSGGRSLRALPTSATRKMAAPLPIAWPGAVARSLASTERCQIIAGAGVGDYLCQCPAAPHLSYRVVVRLKVTVHGRPSTRVPEPAWSVNL